MVGLISDRATMAAATEYYQQMMNDGDTHWDEWLAKRENVRQKVAAFINAEPPVTATMMKTHYQYEIGRRGVSRTFLEDGDSLVMRDGFVTFLTRELGTDSIERAKTYMEDPLRMTVHLIMSTPEYQIV